MADVPPVDATMSNSESQPPQVKTAETLDLNMSTNDTLPADVLGVSKCIIISGYTNVHRQPG